MAGQQQEMLLHSTVSFSRHHAVACSSPDTTQHPACSVQMAILMMLNMVQLTLTLWLQHVYTYMLCALALQRKQTVQAARATAAFGHSLYPFNMPCSLLSLHCYCPAF
jgi:hypothetical protein